MSVLESAVSPEVAKPTWVSTLKIFSMLEGSSRGDVILFSTARTTPSAVWIPIAVDPSWASDGLIQKEKEKRRKEKEKEKERKKRKEKKRKEKEKKMKRKEERRKKKRRRRSENPKEKKERANEIP